MNDLSVLLIGGLFFLTCLGLLAVCERLMGD